jgi:hypothetical protein
MFPRAPALSTGRGRGREVYHGIDVAPLTLTLSLDGHRRQVKRSAALEEG